MKATGIVRRIDDLGRVVIPKEIRRTLHIREGEPMEIFMGREGEIVLKKYSPIEDLGSTAREFVQAMARDCLAVTLERIAEKGLQVVFHVHDEVIIDAPMKTTVEEICDLMAEPIDWAPGLILKGAGFESSYYMKD